MLLVIKNKGKSTTATEKDEKKESDFYLSDLIDLPLAIKNCNL